VAYLLARDRLASVDTWEADRVAQMGVQAARRLHTHTGVRPR